MRSLPPLAAALALATLLAACAGDAPPTPAPAAVAPRAALPPLVLTIETTPPGARCVGQGLQDGVDTTFILEQTPGAMQLSPDARTKPVICSKDGFQPITFDIAAQVPPNATEVTAATQLTPR